MEIPKNNINIRWLKTQDDIEGTLHGKRSSALGMASADFLKKRALLDRAIQVAYGTKAISEEAFTQAMDVMDSVCRLPSSDQGDCAPSGTHDLHVRVMESVVSTCGMFEPLSAHISCPDRPTKKGRPSNSSLTSWKEQQKRQNLESTDEENPKNGKMHPLADVMAV